MNSLSNSLLNGLGGTSGGSRPSSPPPAALPGRDAPSAFADMLRSSPLHARIQPSSAPAAPAAPMAPAPRPAAAAPSPTPQPGPKAVEAKSPKADKPPEAEPDRAQVAGSDAGPPDADAAAADAAGDDMVQAALKAQRGRLAGLDDEALRAGTEAGSTEATALAADAEAPAIELATLSSDGEDATLDTSDTKPKDDDGTATAVAAQPPTAQPGLTPLADSSKTADTSPAVALSDEAAATSKREAGLSDAVGAAAASPLRTDAPREAAHDPAAAKARQAGDTPALDRLATAESLTGDTKARETAVPGGQGAASFESLLGAASAHQARPAHAGMPGASAATPARVDLPQPLYSSGFAPEMAARLSVMAAGGIQHASLHLNPAEMGPVAVKILVDGQQTQISFHSDQAETRALLERSLPELAAALRDSGLTLSGGGVFQQARDPGQGGQQGQAQASAGTQGRSGPAADAPPVMDIPTPVAQRSRGVVDLYA